jgi:chromate transporter
MANAINLTTWNLFQSFLKLGFTAFGGPAIPAQIKGEIVDRNSWIESKQFDEGLALCQIIPGAINMQIAAYVGLKLKGIKGAVLSFFAFGIPSFLIMISLSLLYKRFHTTAAIETILSTLRIVIVAIVAHATYTFGRMYLKGFHEIAIAALAAILFFLKIHPAIVVGIAVILGIALIRKGESGFLSEGKIKTFGFFLLLLVLVLFSILLLYFLEPSYFTLATVMLRIDLFSFGGGLASVPMMYHEIVDLYGWLDKNTLFDGIILGQITPGSIIVTATFAGYLHLGFIGGIVATIFVYLPSFMILMALAPFFNRLSAFANFSKAINGILCSFVGLLLVTTYHFGNEVSWSAGPIIIGLVSLILLFLRVKIPWLIIGGLAFSLLYI